MKNMYLFIAIVFIAPIVIGYKQDCPGKTFRCDDSTTCCQLLDKTYGCCPIKDAICCDDHIHCCPANTKCSTGMCIQQGFNLKITNTSAHIIKSKDVTCPGGKFTCPDETTCCEGEQAGTYGCCPMEDAVCCSDKEHCCPSGTTCNLEKATCNGDNYISPMYDAHKKLFKSHNPVFQLVQIEAEETSVVCPGGSFQCPNFYTCCQLKSGEWGCCPFPKASCCEDGYHCCPENMECDESSTYCRQGLTNITSVRNVPATAITAESIVCPDKSECQETMTCCPIRDAKFGCCQYPNATCCADKLHCCPSGNRCDLKTKRCIPEGSHSNNSIF